MNKDMHNVTLPNDDPYPKAPPLDNEFIDYKLLNQHILSINSQETLEDLASQTAHSFKHMVNYKLFAFVLQKDDGLHIWSDPLLSKDRLLDLVQIDFSQSTIKAIHYIGKRETNIISTFFHKTESVTSYPFTDAGQQARLYLIHDSELSMKEKDISDIIITSFGQTLKMILRISNLEKSVSLDPLTNCYNRRALKDILHHSINNAQRYKRNFSVVMMDIDHFKSINDNYGHLFGDTILKNLTQIIHSFIRQGDSLARYGGEEFVVVLPETPLESAIEMTQRLRWKIENIAFRTPDNETIHITASFGVASLGSDDDSESLLAEADSRLYESKANGRNCVRPILEERTIQKNKG